MLLEGRAPFLDHHLVEFAARLPNRFKVRGFKKKVLFREAKKKLLAKTAGRYPAR